MSYTCVGIPMLSPATPALSCTVPEGSAVGTGALCTSPALNVFASSECAGQLDPVTNNGAGSVHPFVMGNGGGGLLGVVVGPLVGSALNPSYTLRFQSLPQYVLNGVVCLPQELEGLVLAADGTVIPGPCLAFRHETVRFSAVVSVLDVNEPPAFAVTNLVLSQPAVGAPGDLVGFPLARSVSDPDTTPPFGTVQLSVQGGVCTTGSGSTSNAPLPFVIDASTGQLSLSSAVLAKPLSKWANPVRACVVATDGGGLAATLNVTVQLTEVSLQLSVFPTTVTVNHFSFGLSVANLTVSLYVGSHTDVTWVVSSSVATGFPAWLRAVKADDTHVTLTMNSSALVGVPLGSVLPVYGRVTVATSGTPTTRSPSRLVELAIPASLLMVAGVCSPGMFLRRRRRAVRWR